MEIVPSFYSSKKFNKIEQFSNIYLTHCAQNDKIILTIRNNPCKNMGDILEKGDEIMANDDWDIFDKEIKRSMEIARKTMDLCIEPYIKELAIYKRALELACKELMPYRVNMSGGLYTTEELTNRINYFISQAKKELEEEDVKNS